MRQLFPSPLDPVDPAEVYGDPPRTGPGGRPGVRLDMIASVDGATTVDGVSGGLGGAADHDLFTLLRSLADVVLVAAGTVRAEGYGPSRVPVAVVTRSCRLDWASPFFTAPVARPIVVTVAGAPPDALARAAGVAEVVVAGDRDVDLGRGPGRPGRPRPPGRPGRGRPDPQRPAGRRRAAGRALPQPVAPPGRRGRQAHPGRPPGPRAGAPGPALGVRAGRLPVPALPAGLGR
jgi:RibD C-terminal domain